MNGRCRSGSGMMGSSAPPLAALAHCTVMENLSPEALAQVAAYFQALSDPARRAKAVKAR